MSNICLRFSPLGWKMFVQCKPTGSQYRCFKFFFNIAKTLVAFFWWVTLCVIWDTKRLEDCNVTDILISRLLVLLLQRFMPFLCFILFVLKDFSRNFWKVLFVLTEAVVLRLIICLLRKGMTFKEWSTWPVFFCDNRSDICFKSHLFTSHFCKRFLNWPMFF